MPLIDDLLRQAHRDLNAREVRIVALLLQEYGIALRGVERELRTLDAQIGELIASGADINEQYIRRQRWYRELEASIHTEMAKWTGNALHGIEALQTGGVRIGVGVSSAIAQAAGSPFQGRVYASAFEKWVSAIQPGSPLRTITLPGYETRVQQAILQRMTEGVGGGKAPRSIVREIMRDVGGVADEARIMTLARSESMRAYRGASADTMEPLREREIVFGYVWLATLAPGTCIACIERHGTFYPEYPTGWHLRCRCVARAVVDPNILPGGGWKGQTGPEWFAEQDAETQRAILGDARFEAYRGGVPLSDMTMVRHDPVWGPTVGIRPVGALGRAA